MRVRGRLLIVLSLVGVLLAAPVLPQSSSRLVSETPKDFHADTSAFDFERRIVEIPMRDGVRLHTVILVPKGAHRRPMLLTRTPYDADGMTQHANSNHLVDVLNGYDNFPALFADGRYIRVVQDIRGKYKSQGDYVMNRPLHGPLNGTKVDHATDTWDTIDWLVKNVGESNGKVGILGISYDGFTSLMALVDPHPALKAAVPMNPMVDGWMGDDWFHNGAFRQINLPYMHDQVGTRDNSQHWWDGIADQYQLYLKAGSAGALGDARGMRAIGFYRKLLEHPTYDAFWKAQAVDKLLAERPLTVPTMLVHGLWDQEDIYGAPAVYRALQVSGNAGDNLWMVMGPWNHGGQRGEGSTLGAIRFDSDTALTFNRDMLAPFLDHFLQDDAPALDLARVTAFRSGDNRWERLASWPQGCASGCNIEEQPLYLQPGMGLSFAAPAEVGVARYVSDPSKPVPYLPVPIPQVGYGEAPWPRWLTTDQRPAATRPDVLVFESDVLTAPVRIAGRPEVDLLLSTTGEDGDFVVKLIDVYPDAVPGQPAMAGFQLMVSADILRARYRNDPAKPERMVPGQRVRIRFALPDANHAFLPGHRLMVQVQSTWFPLYDRNPQAWVDNIFLAKPGDYRPVTIDVSLGGATPSAVVLPVVRAP